MLFDIIMYWLRIGYIENPFMCKDKILLPVLQDALYVYAVLGIRTILMAGSNALTWKDNEVPLVLGRDDLLK